MSVVSMRKLQENGVHFGHQTRRWNPKMKPYIYTAKNDVYIVDLAKTQEKLEEAYNAMHEIAERGGKVLFVGTKKQAQQIVMEEALRSGSFYVNQRWLGGTLTNFRTIQKRIRRLIELNEMVESGSMEIYPKKEQAALLKEQTKLENFLGGIREMKKTPDALFVVDPTEDKIAVLEARKLNIPVFGFADTNCDPDFLDYMIPGNDDAIKSIKLVVGIMADAIVDTKEGVMQYAYQPEEEEDITMKEVIVAVEKQNEENERRRRQRNEERRQQQNNRNQRRNWTRREDRPQEGAEESAQPAAVEEAVEAKVEEVKETVETKVEEKVEEVKKTVEAKVEEKVEEVKEAVEEVKEAAEEKVEEIKEAVEEKVEEVKEAVEEKVEEVKKTTRTRKTKAEKEAEAAAKAAAEEGKEGE